MRGFGAFFSLTLLIQNGEKGGVKCAGSRGQVNNPPPSSRIDGSKGGVAVVADGSSIANIIRRRRGKKSCPFTHFRTGGLTQLCFMFLLF